MLRAVRKTLLEDKRHCWNQQGAVVRTVVPRKSAAVLMEDLSTLVSVGNHDGDNPLSQWSFVLTAKSFGLACVARQRR